MQSQASPAGSISSRASFATTGSAETSVDVIKRNNLVFRKFEKTFKDVNDPAFAENAAKLAVWLTSEKGYYEAARPEIVKLLMIMQNTLRTAVGVELKQTVPFPPQAHKEHPMSEAYQKLVRTVHRHAHTFVESRLQVLLKGLFFSVDLPYTPNTGSTAGGQSTSADITSPAATSIVSPKRHVPNAVNTKTAPAQGIPGSVPPQSTVTSQVPESKPHGPIQGQPTSISGIVGPTSTAQIRQSSLQDGLSIPKEPEPSDKKPGDIQTSASLPNLPGEAGTTTVRKKKKKKNSLGIDTLVEMDLKTYMAKQGQGQTPITPQSSASFYGEAGQSFIQPKAEEVILPSALSGDLGQGQLQVQPKTGETSAVVNAPLPSREIIEILDSPEPQHQEPGPTVIVKSEPQGSPVIPTKRFTTTYVNDTEVIDLTSDIEDAMDVDQAPVRLAPSMEAASVEMDVSEPPPTESQAAPRDASPFEVRSSPIPQTGGGESHLLVAQVATVASSSSIPPNSDLEETPSKESAPAPDTTGPRGNEGDLNLQGEEFDMVIDPAAAAIRSPEIRPEKASIQRTKEWRKTATDETNKAAQADQSIVPEPAAVARTPTPTPPPQIGQTKVETSSKQASPTKDNDNDNDVHMEERPSEEQGQEPVQAALSQSTDEPMPPGIYGSDMRVIAVERGQDSKKARIEFAFPIDEANYARTVTWKEQKASLSDLRNGLCISLACHPITQLELQQPLSPQLMSLASTWPDGGGLSMKVTYLSTEETFSLSPPVLLITPDCTVDLSMFIKVGDNKLQIRQHKDWSEHVFVLLSHRPTEKQIEKVKRKREEDDGWEDWKKKMALPIKVDLSKLSAPFPTSNSN
ncbi:hypothetical protein D9611_004532 [Ephemerocybe angulata]|uniref:Uncharacterized protein n=1 Tax=Ephemerocybe angulata TaxID=980116 RepID=A0A8H5BK27_9AGAR|nr:hypothetical protein D9611_004532 [Tulosesus angulatus]